MRPSLLALWLSTSLAFALSIESLLERDGQIAKICSTLAHAFPGQVEDPGTANYTTETTDYWSFRNYLHPFCVFVPTTAQNLADGVKILAKTNTTFAVRSGGHSPVAGVSNTDNGVLVTTTNFDELTVVPAPNSLGTGYVRMGASKRWGQVYDFLSPQGLNVVGGRVWSVGSSAVLGGGISYLSNRHGWASDNILNLELVTGEGKVLQVNNHTYPDLYWAIKGGGNNFGIITRYDLKTFPQGPVFGGTLSYKPENIQDYLDAYQAWINPGGGHEDIDGSIMPNMNYFPLLNQTVAGWVGIHNSPVDNPRAFENFTKIPTTTNEVGVMNFSQVIDQSKGFGGSIARANWFATALQFYNESLQLQYDTLISTANELIPGLNVTVGVVTEPVTVDFQENSRLAGGDAIDLDPAHGSFTILLVYAFWFDESLDATMENYLQTLIKNLDTASKANGKYYPFIWLNNAGDTQDPFPLYGYGKSLRRLKKISKKYDPNAVFQRLVPGFKLNGPKTQ